MFDFFGVARRWISDKIPEPTNVVPPFHLRNIPVFWEDQTAYRTDGFLLQEIGIDGGKWLFRQTGAEDWEDQTAYRTDGFLLREIGIDGGKWLFRPVWADVRYDSETSESNGWRFELTGCGALEK